jgi:putative transposase
VARLARVIAVDIPHHVTQRGNARRFILDCDAERTVYLSLLWQDVELYGVSLIGYCLMSNHVHLVTIPRKADELSLALRHTHGRYASYWNALHQCSGHVWQGRYYSCPLDPLHLWKVLRYTELNPENWGTGKLGDGREVYRRELCLSSGDRRAGRHELNLNITSLNIFLPEFQLWDACLES